MTENVFNSKDISTNVRVNNIRQTIFGVLLERLWRIAPGFSKKIVKRLFFAPARYATSPLEEDCLKNSRAFEIYVNNARIKCWKWGRGPTVLLAHGWNGRGIQLYRFIQPLTEAGYAVLTFDGPGHGESEGKTSSYFEYSDVIRYFFRFAEDYQIKGAIAHSFGAAAVINAMVKENYDLEAVLIASALKLNQVLADTFNAYGVPDFIFRDLIKEYEERFGYNLRADDPIKLLARIRSGILIVHDTEDETISYGDSVSASRICGRILLHTTHGLGHKRILYDHHTVDFVIKRISRKIKPQAFQHGLNAGEENTMESTQQLLEDYRAGDFEKRLYLFLECPELRADFIEIDLGKPDSRAAV